MKVFEYLDRIGKMHKLVKNRRTGTPVEFAHQLGLSRTSLYELIDEMRIRGAPISYSKSARTFYYSLPYEISITCSMKQLTYSEEKEVSGGAHLLSRILFFRTLLSEISMVAIPC